MLFDRREIQTNQSGHCSIEDAKACMELVQMKLEKGIEYLSQILCRLFLFFQRCVAKTELCSFYFDSFFGLLWIWYPRFDIFVFGRQEMVNIEPGIGECV